MGKASTFEIKNDLFNPKQYEKLVKKLQTLPLISPLLQAEPLPYSHNGYAELFIKNSKHYDTHKSKSVTIDLLAFEKTEMLENMTIICEESYRNPLSQKQKQRKKKKKKEQPKDKSLKDSTWR